MQITRKESHEKSYKGVRFYNYRMKINLPETEIKELVSSGAYIGESIDFEVLGTLGVFLLKNAFSRTLIKKYEDFYFNSTTDSLRRTEGHRTEVRIYPNHPLRGMYEEPEFLNLVKLFFGGNVGSDFIRILKKDSLDFKPVFLHQDLSYQLGGFEKYSIFIPLTRCNQDNGSLIFFPSTHHFGYLGDSGEIKESLLPSDFPKIVSDLDATDAFIMHSAIWHKSPENKNKTDRVYLEIHIQPNDDPTTRTILCGERKSKFVFNVLPNDIFTNMPRLTRR
jgi:hypothetical protein